MRLQTFQRIDIINGGKGDEIDKLLFSVCEVFGFTEHQLDSMPAKKAMKYLAKTKALFEKQAVPKPVKRIGRYVIEYDVSKLTFGQYIELVYFISGNALHNAHYILATCSHLPFCKNNAGKHRAKSQYFLNQPLNKTIGCIPVIAESLAAFNKEYQTLFGIDKEVSGDVQGDVFNKRYGWIYSASQIAEYERVTLEQAFALPVRQAMNDLAYLKAKNKYESEQLKKNSNVR